MMRHIVIVPSETERLYVAGFLKDLFHFDTTTLLATQRLEADLGIDSLGLIEVAMEFEARFGIEVPDDVTFRLTTVKDIMDLYMHRQDYLFF